MTLFSVNYTPHQSEAGDVVIGLMEAWEGQRVADSVWILKRNDGCTCQTVMDDLLEHISAANEISVVEIKQKTRNHNEA